MRLFKSNRKYISHASSGDIIKVSLFLTFSLYCHIVGKPSNIDKHQDTEITNEIEQNISDDLTVKNSEEHHVLRFHQIKYFLSDTQMSLVPGKISSLSSNTSDRESISIPLENTNALKEEDSLSSRSSNLHKRYDSKEKIILLVNTSSTLNDSREVATESYNIGRVKEKEISSHIISHNLSSQYEPEEETDEYDDELGDQSDLPVEQKLMNKLLKNYERSVRPVKNANDILLVRMGLTMTQIFDMDEKNQILVTNVWLDQEWDDMLLKWNPNDFGGLKILRLPCQKIWLPDIVLYNNAAEYTDGMMPANAMITSDGNVFWPVPSKLQSTCKVDVTYFPFDEQKCRLKFGSWTYDGFQVDMTNRSIDVDLTNYVPNGEWELLGVDVQRNIVYYACCKEPFPDVTFIIHIRRRLTYYLYNVIFPCVMMSALTLLVFCLPPDSGEKITMGITVLLAFSVFLLRLGEDLPETSEFIPLLSVYLTIVMALTSVSVIMTVFVLNLHYRGPNDVHVPAWIKYIIQRTSGNMHKNVSTSGNLDKNLPASSCGAKGLVFHQPIHVQGTLSQPIHVQGTLNATNNCEYSVSLKLTLDNLAEALKSELDNGRHSGELLSSAEKNVSLNNSKYNKDGKLIGDQLVIERAYRSSKVSDDNTRAISQEEVVGALRRIVDKYDKEELSGSVLYEWRQLAILVDKLLFTFFLTATVASTVIILVVVPLTKSA